MGAGLPLLALRADLPEPGSFRTTPFYEAIASIVENPFVHRTTHDGLKAFYAISNMLVILTHDASLLDVLDLPTADLTVWEKEK